MTTPNDIFNIPGHSLVCRVDGNVRTPGTVSHIYSQNSAKSNSIFTRTSCHNNGIIEIIAFEISDPSEIHGYLTMMSVYSSPRVPIYDFMLNFDAILARTNMSPLSLVIGYFNVDLLSVSRDRSMFLDYFASKDFYPAISGISTNYSSQLDCTFAKGIICTINLYESYFSDHKPLLINFEDLSRGNLLEKQLSPPFVTEEKTIGDFDKIRWTQM